MRDDGFEFQFVDSWKAAESRITSMTFVRDRNYSTALAVADSRHDLRLWDPPLDGSAPEQLRVLEQGSRADDICYVPQQQGWQSVGAVGDGNTVRLHSLSADPAGSRAVAVGLAHHRLHRVAAMRRRDGTAAMIVGVDNEPVRIWNAGNHSEIVVPGNSTGKIHAIRVFGPEQWIVTVRDVGGIAVVDYSGVDPVPVKTFGDGDDKCVVTAYSPLGQPLLVTGSRHGIRIWDPCTGAKLRSFARGYDVSRIVTTTTRSGELLLIASHENTVRLWRPYAETSVLPEAARTGARITALTRVNAGDGATLLAAGDNDGMVYLWRQPPPSFARGRQLSHRSWVNAVVVPASASAATRLVVTASDDGDVRLWDRSREGNNVQHLTVPEGDTGPVQALALLPGGELAAGRESGRIDVWSLIRPEEVRTSGPVADSRIRAMIGIGSAEQTLLVSAGDSGKVTVWDPVSLEPLRTLDGAVNGQPNAERLVRALATIELPTTTLLAAADNGGSIRLWHTETWIPAAVRLRSTPDRTQIRKLTTIIHRGDMHLVAGYDDGCIRLWNMNRAMANDEPADGVEPVIVINSRHGVVSALATLSPGRSSAVVDHPLLASGGSDGVIRLWDPGSPDEPSSEVRRAHGNWVRSLAFHVTDSAVTLISGGADGSARVWPFVNGELFPWASYDTISRGFADRPARFELMDRKPLIRALVETLLQQDEAGPQARDTQASQLTSGPQVIAVHGRWGSGKTSLMRLLQRALDAPAVREGWWSRLRRRLRPTEITPHQALKILRTGSFRAQPRHRPAVATAWFNPWTYQTSTQVWSGLAWTIIEDTNRHLGPVPADRQRFWLAHNLPRIDRGRVARSLWLRVWAPAVTMATVFIAPLATKLLTDPELSRSIQGGKLFSSLLGGRWSETGLNTPAELAAAALAVCGVGLFLVTAYRYWRGRAAANLPEDLLDGPLVPALALPDQAQTNLARENSPHTHSGALQWLHRDVGALIKGLNERGVQLVVFIDDLDRCTPATTREVFEAVSGILQYDVPRVDDTGRSGIRFVMGVDPELIAYQLDVTDPARMADLLLRSGSSPLSAPVPYELPPLSGTIAGHGPDDPSNGWATIRKLWQLAVILPPTPLSHTDRLMRHHFPGFEEQPKPAAGGPPTVSPGGDPPAGSARSDQFRQGSGPDHAVVESVVTPSSSTSDGRDQPVATDPQAWEDEPVVLDHLRSLVALRPLQSMRETKRLLTLWSFFLRLKRERVVEGLSEPITSAQQCCDVMTLAEILTRWPALVPALTRWHVADGVPPRSVLDLLTRAAENDAAWHLASMDLVPAHLSDLSDHLRRLLLAHVVGADRGVVELAEELLCGGTAQYEGA